MKSKTLSSDFTVLKKDMLRFAPVWVLYGIAGLMILMALAETESGYWFAKDVAAIAVSMSVINLFYALVNAQVLFGDLYNSRMCNALHAMPMRRERWFTIHIIAGILYSLIPNLVIMLMAIPLLGNGWSAIIWWLAAAELTYLFFFGIAVFSTMCAGNRIGMGIMYGLINFISVLIHWIVVSLYEPMLYGMIVREDWAVNLCPTVKVFDFELIEVERIGEAPFADSTYTVSVGDGWWYVGICAVLGVLFLAAALMLYRRRKLESAGDFLAVRPAEPIFLVMLTTMAGVVFMEFFNLLVDEKNLLILLLGVAVGFFIGQMLLKRTTKVFHKKVLLGFGVYVAVLAATLVLVRVDPVGITRWVPGSDNVKSVTIGIGNGYYSRNMLVLEDEEDIANIIEIHQGAVDRRKDDKTGLDLMLEYTMESGIVKERYYYIPEDIAMDSVLRTYFSSVECVVGVTAEELPQLMEDVEYLYIQGESFGDGEDHPMPDLEGLAAAIIADCQAGNMAQDWTFHHDSDIQYYVELCFKDYKQDGSNYLTIYAYDECENIIAWTDALNIAWEK